MSSGCGDVISLEDLRIAKLHQLFEAEVITGLQGGVAGGSAIDYATNQVTGQTQKTMPAVLRDAGFRPASFTFTTGGTLGTNDADLAVLWPITSGGDGNYYAWKGALPKVIPASSTPTGTGGVSTSGWVPFGDITLRGQLLSVSSGNGSSLVWHKNKNASSSGRSLKSILDDYTNITDFMVSSDGIDILSACNKAIADGCKKIHIPAGDWTLSGNATFPVGTSISGDGYSTTKITFTTTSSGIFLNSDLSTIDGIRFVAGAANIPFAVKIDSGWGSVTNCFFDNPSTSLYFAVQLYSFDSFYCKYTDNTFRASVAAENLATATGQIACMADHSVNCTFINNVVMYHDKGVYLTSAASGGGNRCEGWTISDNQMVVCGCFVQVQGGLYITTDNNIFDLHRPYFNPIYLDGSSCIVSNNWLTTNVNPSLIIDSSTSSPYGRDRNLWLGNIMNGNSSTATILNVSGGAGFFTFKDNQVFTCTGTAIGILNASTYGIYTDNHFINCQTGIASDSTANTGTRIGFNQFFGQTIRRSVDNSYISIEPIILAGKTSVNLAGGTTNSTTVTFPASAFGHGIIPTIGIATVAGVTTAPVQAFIQNFTNTSFDIQVHAGGATLPTGSCVVHWQVSDSSV